MLEPENVWKSTYQMVPPSNTPIWSTNIAAWYASRIAIITPDPAMLVATGFLFTFNQAIFNQILSSSPPAPDSKAAMAIFAGAWEAAMLASAVVVAPGSFIPPTTPATLFSAVALTIIDPASITIGKQKVMSIGDEKVPDDPKDIVLPIKFFEASKSLTITVTGLNSVAPTPAPLVAAGVKLI